MSSTHARGEADATSKSAVSGNTNPETKNAAASGQQPEQAKPTEFAALLAAMRPQTGQQGLAGKGLADPAQQPADAALEGMTAELNALLTTFTEGPDAPDLSEMMAAFVGLLQQYDAATGGDATALLAENLVMFDSADLAALNMAASDPASLFASLAALAEVPLANSAGMLVPAAQVPQQVWSHIGARGDALNAQPAIALKAKDGADGLLRPNLAQPLAASADVKPSQQPSVAGDGRVDVRAVVMTALAATGAGAGPDAVALPSAPGDNRSAAAAAPEIARPAEASPPPASGFARNLAQQIRHAKFTDGHTRITLAPRGLGEIEIDMRPDEAGKLRIVLRAENAAVLHALRGDRDGLLLTLTESGTDVRDADLSFEDFSHRQRRNAELSDALAGGVADASGQDAPDVTVLQPRINAAGTVDMLT
ncbi:MAG: flagellar hook-length control protein FliK [Rhodobacterales bacterium]